MRRDARFWRNLTIIGLAHVAILVGLIRWSRQAKKANPSEIVWMAGGVGSPEEVAASVKLAPNESEQTPSPTPESSATEGAHQPNVAPVKSEIQLPTPTPLPIPTMTPALKPTETSRPKPSTTPKSITKPTPKSTPKKTVVARVSPKSAKKNDSNPSDVAGKKKEIAEKGLTKKHTSDAEGDSEKPATKTKGADGSGKPVFGKHGKGAGAESEFGWYGNMLHDRFYSAWDQPTTVVASGVKLSTLVKLRIQKDGRVSDFTIIQPSGNVVVDESVASVAKRVTQVDPLPVGLGGDFYEVKINFELNPEQ